MNYEERLDKEERSRKEEERLYKRPCYEKLEEVVGLGSYVVIGDVIMQTTKKDYGKRRKKITEKKK